MTRKILALLLVLCLLSGCGVPSPRRAAVPAQKIPCCPIAEQEPITRELPDDKQQGDYVVVTMMLPRELPEEIFGPDGSMTLFTAHYFNNHPELSYQWGGGVLWKEYDPSVPATSAPGGTEISVKIPFRDSITFHTTDTATYDNGMKVSAAFHYKDGRTVEASYDGLGLADIELDSHGTITAVQNPYVYEEGQEIDVTASYKGVDTDVTQILRGKQNLYCKVQLLHGLLATGSLSGYTLTAVDPAGKETVTDYTGDELSEHSRGYQDYDYCTISCPSINDLQIEDPEGIAIDPYSETEKISAERTVFRSYYPGAELGPPYFALDVPWQESFRVSLSPDRNRWWAGVTYKSPEGQKGTLCVSGIPDGTAELFWDGTAVLEGDLSEFTVFYLPPGEETALSLTGKGQEQVTVYFDNGELTAYGTGVEYTTEETDISAMPFDPGELPAIISGF